MRCGFPVGSFMIGSCQEDKRSYPPAPVRQSVFSGTSGIVATWVNGQRDQSFICCIDLSAREMSQKIEFENPAGLETKKRSHLEVPPSHSPGDARTGGRSRAT